MALNGNNRIEISTAEVNNICEFLILLKLLFSPQSDQQLLLVSVLKHQSQY